MSGLQDLCFLLFLIAYPSQGPGDSRYYTLYIVAIKFHAWPSPCLDCVSPFFHSKTFFSNLLNAHVTWLTLCDQASLSHLFKPLLSQRRV